MALIIADSDIQCRLVSDGRSGHGASLHTRLETQRTGWSPAPASELMMMGGPGPSVNMSTIQYRAPLLVILLGVSPLSLIELDSKLEYVS